MQASQHEVEPMNFQALGGYRVFPAVEGHGKVLAAVGSAEEAYNDVTFWDCADDIKKE